MPEINVHGQEVNYINFGTDYSSKPTAVFIHGACQSTLCWENQINVCKSYKRFNSIIMDLPGHGKSGGDGFKKIDEYTKFLKSFTNKLELTELVLIGHSMGGRIAQTFILKNLGKVIGSVLVGTSTKIKFSDIAIEKVHNDFEGFCKMATNNSFSQNASEESKRLFYNRLKEISQQTCINDLKTCNSFDTTSDISNINVPTLIIAGKHDRLTTVSDSRYLNKQIKDSKMFVLDSGHFTMIEKPEQFNKLLIRFFDFL